MNEKWVFGMFKYNIKTIKEISCFWKLNPNFQLVKIIQENYSFHNLIQNRSKLNEEESYRPRIYIFFSHYEPKHISSQNLFQFVYDLSSTWWNLLRIFSLKQLRNKKNILQHLPKNLGEGKRKKIRERKKKNKWFRWFSSFGSWL